MASGDTKTGQLLDALENGGDTSRIVGCCNTNLQNYLIDSINSVQEAKDIIVEKGGTVGDTGLAGLADEIESIPSGGGTEDWGTVTYLNAQNVEVTATIQDVAEYLSLGETSTNPGSPITVDGVTVEKSKITKVALGKTATATPYNFLYGAANLTSLTGTENLVVLEGGFLSHCSGFNQVLDLRNVTTIRDYFLTACTSYNQPITLPAGVKEFGEGFLDGCSSFNSTINLGSVEKIARYFMHDCTAFAQPLSIPTTIASVSSAISGDFMRGCNNFTGPLECNAPTSSGYLATSTGTLSTTNSSAPMYATGVTLTGPYASAWKFRYDDRTSSPYRKLILSE